MKTLVEQFEHFDGYKKVLFASGKSAVHDSCANFSTTEFQTDRGKLIKINQIKWIKVFKI